MKGRVSVLVNHLTSNPSCTNLIGHSAGCAVIAEALSQELIPKTVKKIVFLNPAPLPGTMFTPFDKIYWAMPKYLMKLITGADIKLSSSDARKLMSLSSTQLENLGDSFLPDSGKFTRHMVLSQWIGKYKHKLDVSAFDFTIVAAKSDDMVGRKTAGKVAKALFFGKKKIMEIEGGHLETLLRFETVVGEALS